jgi:hypothetical protein
MSNAAMNLQFRSEVLGFGRNVVDLVVMVLDLDLDPNPVCIEKETYEMLLISVKNRQDL